MIVRCDGGGHRVRLRGGVHFWKSARCPTCGAPVDPRRWRRIRRWATNLLRPASDHPLDRATWVATAVAVVGTLLGVGYFRLGADVWWPATVALFGPRWLALVPMIPVVGLAAIRDRALLTPLALAAWLLIGPFLGFRTGIGGAVTGEREEDVTIATLNVAGGSSISYGPALLMDHLGADILMVQECARSFRATLGSLPDWYSWTRGSLCALSRYPILATSVMDGETLQSVGGSAQVATLTLDLGGRPIHVTNVHLETPREGLALIRAGRLRAGGEITRQKSILREIELRRAERWAREGAHPAVVVGDFNTPPESRHFRRIWSDWTDAFAAAGFGVGATRDNGWIRARIDYVVVDDAWTVVRAGPGEPVGSDHLPMVARLRLDDDR